VAPPASLGRITTVLPGIHTGNIDNKDLGANTILYMPIQFEVPYSLREMAMHLKAMGKLTQTAIETGLRGRFQFFVRKDWRLKWPRAETATHWVVMGVTRRIKSMRLLTSSWVDFLI
jgi:acetamidase/formamidase